ncbi:MAG: succinyl-diaminopimelate desuccinylase, partial [Hyphomicrobiales bacterium]|nr:succinyl-diaminopimelate desuccinylase [Hyphomicrobiales bacterium]
GGTSDGRFIHRYAPVLEFGPLNTSIHQIDEHIALADLTALTEIYRTILERYFSA